MGSFFASVAVQWFLRRILDWGGWLGGFLLFVINTYNALPPSLQAAIVTVIEGRWQEITLGSLIPLLALIWSQIASFRATVKPQIVTEEGKVADMRELPRGNANAVQEIATTAILNRGETIVERLLKLKLGRR
jgi:hypothetical protein